MALPLTEVFGVLGLRHEGATAIDVEALQYAIRASDAAAARAVEQLRELIISLPHRRSNDGDAGHPGP